MRESILKVIRFIAANPEANEADLVAGLVRIGYETLAAEVLVVFVPLGLARALFNRLPAPEPIPLADHALILHGGQELAVPLRLVPEFVEAVRLGEETFTTGVISRADYTQTVQLSVELNLINQTFNAGTTVAIISAPVLIRLGDAPGFEDWYSGIKDRSSP